MKSNIIIKYINQYKYSIAIILFVIINLITLNNLPWGDDYPFVFDSFIRKAPTPLEFWDPYSVYFKSWSLSYSVLWTFLNTVGDQTTYYRVFNLFIHIINSLLLVRVIKNIFKLEDKTKTFAIFFLYLVHPISMITVNWIFQIKTLLSMFFCLSTLLSFNKINENVFKYTFLTIFLFFCSLTSKVATILLPTYFFYKRASIKNIKAKYIVLIICPILSVYYGLINIKGIQAVWSEKNNLKKSVIEYSEANKNDKAEVKVIILDEAQAKKVEEKKLEAAKQAKAIKEQNTNKQAPSTPVKVKEKKREKIYTLKDNKLNIDLSEEFEESIDSFADQFIQPNLIRDKLLISFFTFGRYITHSLGFNIFSIIYEKNSQSLYAYKIITFSILSFIFVWFLMGSSSRHALILCLILYLPISGFFYVPYMKISYISDHWFYLALPFFTIAIVQRLNTKAISILMILISFQSLYSTYTFSTSRSAIQHSFNTYNNSFSKEYLIRHEMAVKNYKAAYELSKSTLEEFSNKKEDIIKAKFVINSKHLQNKHLWNDTKELISLYYNKDQMEEITPVMLSKFQGGNLEERQILNHLKFIIQKQTNELMFNEIINILSPNKKQSNGSINYSL